MISSIEIKTDRGLKGFKFSHKKNNYQYPATKIMFSFVISSCIYKRVQFQTFQGTYIIKETQILHVA